MKISKREQQVLQLIAEEYTTNEIASQLYVSRETIKTHRRTLLSKVGARNAAGLVRRAFELQILGYPQHINQYDKGNPSRVILTKM